MESINDRLQPLLSQNSFSQGQEFATNNSFFKKRRFLELVVIFVSTTVVFFIMVLLVNAKTNFLQRIISSWKKEKVGIGPTTDVEKINFVVQEQFTNTMDGPHLYLKVATQEEYGCSNYRLEYALRIRGNNIDVDIGDVVKPGMCLTSIGPARFSEELGINDGPYTLTFRKNNFTDKYSLRVNKESVLVDLIRANFSKTDQGSVKRLPENLLWADCFYNADWQFNPKDDFCANFFNELAKIAKSYFAIEPGKTPKNQFYIYSGSEQPLVGLIEKYNRKGFYVKIATWEGKAYFCSGQFDVDRCDMPTKAGIPRLKVYYLKESKTEISECQKDDVVCVSEVASNLGNESLCELLPIDKQGQCFGDVGIAKLDSNLCSKTDKCLSCRQKCYTYIAIQKNNPDLCEEMNSIYRDDCYIEYADVKRDVSFCDLVRQSGRIQWCQDRFK